MQDIKYHKESFFHTRFWIVVLLIVAVLLSISVTRIYKKYAHAKSIRDEYILEFNQVQESKKVLEKNIQALSTDRGKESEVRDRYRVVKEGEQMILIVDNHENTEEISEIYDGQEITAHPSFFQKIVLFWKKL